MTYDCITFSCIVLYCTVLDCIVLYCNVSYCVMFYYMFLTYMIYPYQEKRFKPLDPHSCRKRDTYFNRLCNVFPAIRGWGTMSTH